MSELRVTSWAVAVNGRLLLCPTCRMKGASALVVEVSRGVDRRVRFAIVQEITKRTWPCHALMFRLLSN